MDELRRLPYSREAEQSVLGSVLLDSRAVPAAIETLSGEDFYLEPHRNIFDAVYALFAAGAQIDPVTVLAQMRSDGTYKEPQSREYMALLMQDTPTAAHIRTYAAIVKEQSLKRQVLDAAQRVQEMAYEAESEAAATIDAAEQLFFDIRKDRLRDAPSRIPEVLSNVLLELKKLSESGSRLPGISTGITQLDGIIGGLINSNFVLVASRPGVGKTAFALNLTAHVARFTGKAVAVFSLEMSRQQLALRMLSSEAQVDTYTLLTAAMTDREWKALTAASSALAKMDIWFDDKPDVTVTEMKSKCRRIQNLGLVVVDYLQLMQGNPKKRFDNRTAEVADISRSLKIMAKELNVPVLCLSQLSREIEKQKRTGALLSDIRESGAIEQDADVVMFLRKGVPEDKRSADDMLGEDEIEITVAKNRHGRTDKVVVEWQAQYTRVTEKDWRHAEE
ncbi:MAG: replicative DNA helicase [Oscillospiraceae bacterium]|jgi:replicative DNA helicase|nr:replicative DNA helicase [Oscillospiraceae bacterium]